MIKVHTVSSKTLRPAEWRKWCLSDIYRHDLTRRFNRIKCPGGYVIFPRRQVTNVR